MVSKMPMPYYFRYLKYFRMADNNKGEDVPCVYVYEDEKNLSPDHNDSPNAVYQNDDIPLENGGRNDLPTRNESTRQDQTKKKQKRRSLYDENHYALPDYDDDKQPETPESLSLRDPDSTAKSMVPSIWRTACCFLFGLMLLSITANIVFVHKKDQRGNIKI